MVWMKAITCQQCTLRKHVQLFYGLVVNSHGPQKHGLNIFITEQ